MFVMFAARMLSSLLAAVLLLAVGVLGQDGCKLALDIDPAQSSWTLDAFINNATGSRVTSDITTERIGAQGRLFLFTTGTCPTDVPSALDILQGARLAPYFPIDTVHARMWPPTIQTRAAGVGRLDVVSLEWDFSSQVFNNLALENVPVGQVMLQVRTRGDRVQLLLKKTSCGFTCCVMKHI